MMWQYFSEKLIILIIGLFGGLLATYFKEKGKNIATKEDVQEITSLVEDVKVVYIKTIEDFKKDISKEVQKYSEEIKIRTQDNYKRYVNLYSKLYQAVVQSEYVRKFNDMDLGFEVAPFIEISKTRSSRVHTQGKIPDVSEETIHDDVTELNKKSIIEQTINNYEYASEKLQKVIIKYRYVHQFYLITDHPQHHKFCEEEIVLLKELIELIIVETNEIKKLLGFEYNQIEVDTRRLVD